MPTVNKSTEFYFEIDNIPSLKLILFQYHLDKICETCFTKLNSKTRLKIRSIRRKKKKKDSFKNFSFPFMSLCII